MKTVIACLVLTLVPIWTHAEMYDPFQKTMKIKKERSGAGLLKPPPLLPATMPPLIQPISVSAVMGERAFINGEWYRIGDRVNNKEITFIQKNFVGLKEGNRLTMIGVGTQRRVLGTKEVK